MRLLVNIVLFDACLASSSFADELGTLKGRFIFFGKPPEVKPIKINKDPAACGDRWLDESLVIDPKTRGIANVVVQLYLTPKEKTPIHPAITELRKASKELKMVGCRIEPHIFTILTQQWFVVANDDPVGHILKINVHANPAWSEVEAGGLKIRKRFQSPEKLPAELSCSIHPWMRGYVVITEHPFVAATDSQGSFAIPDLPPGQWTFRVWHERSQAIEKVKRDGKHIEWSKGRFTLDVRPGENYLGKIFIAADEFPAQ